VASLMSKTSKHRIRSLLINGFLVLLAFGLLGGVIWDKKREIGDILHRDLDFRLIGLAFAIYELSLLLTFVRWYWLVKVIEPKFRPWDAGLLGFIGNVFNLVIPGAVGGDLIKAAYLVRMQIKKTQAIASMVIDRILGLLGLFVLAGVAGGLVWASSPIAVKRLIVIVWVFLAVGFFGLGAVFNQSLTRRYPGLLHGHGRLSLILTELKEMSETYRRRLDVVFKALLSAMVGHSMNVIAFYLMSRTIFPKGVPSVADHFLLVPLTLFTTAVPIPFGAMGVSEHISEELFKMVNLPDGDLAMMGFRVLMYAGGAVSACVYLANLRTVRGLTEAAEHLQDDEDNDEGPPVAA
jgi:uncharacterized protein (TIRG00374 family)